MEKYESFKTLTIISIFFKDLDVYKDNLRFKKYLLLTLSMEKTCQ